MSSFLDGLTYREEVLERETESRLISLIGGLEFEPFVVRGYPSKRRVCSFGMALSFRSGTSWPARKLPDWLEPALAAAAQSSGLKADDFAHVLVTEYPPGAIINWHRDAAEFELICGLSLGSSARLRLRPASGEQRPGSGYGPGRKPGTSGLSVVSLQLAPRSLYIMAGPARHDWEHSIAPLQDTRYSITLRTLAASQGGTARHLRSN
ncbi:alpha-ketoglutarate-dependent dioxygenase AlkB [bacterium]|nr:alpha-ketoglutarate-dependent dioxygenase AlkB [bacterium]